MSDREVQEEAQRELTVSQTQELTPTDDTLNDDTSSEDTSSDEDTEERTLKHYPGVNFFAIILNGYDQTIIVGILILFLFIFIPVLMMKARKIK